MINFRGVRQYCREDYRLIENYQEAVNDKEHSWHCHHRNEIQDDGTVYTPKQLQAMGLYYDRPASELIFVTRGEHTKIHMKGEKHPFYGKQLTIETKQKISESLKGKQHTIETKQKISESLKGKQHTIETKQKMSEAITGRRWYNNGIINKQCKECPEGFVPGRLKKSR